MEMHKRVRILYTNYRGVTELRTVIPTRLHFGQVDFHGPDEQWLLEAFCCERGDPRTFAMKDVHWWGKEKPT